MNKKLLIAVIAFSFVTTPAWIHASAKSKTTKTTQHEQKNEPQGAAPIAQEAPACPATEVPQTQTASAPAPSPKRTTVDKIVARVNGANILLSDLTMPRISKEGAVYTLDEAIFEELLWQRATEMHMLPTATEVERYITSFKMQNNLNELSDKEFEAQLKQYGFTLKMYKQQYARMIAVDKVKQAEISEKIVITTQEVEEYYKKHPLYTKDEFHIKVYTLPEKGAVAQPEDDEKAWQDLGWIKQQDLSKHFEGVVSMQPGQVSEPFKNDEGQMQKFKLIEKKASRLKTVEERYSAIERTLQNAKKKNFITELEKEFKAKASIVYL